MTDHNSPHQFDHERLDFYQLELAFVSWVTSLLIEIRDNAKGFHREVCDQLDRASLSALLNTAEGNGKRQGRQRAKFFDDARGSAIECAACLDALVARKLADALRVKEGKSMLLRIVGMLAKLVERFDESSKRVREDESFYGPENGSRPSFSKGTIIEDERLQCQHPENRPRPSFSRSSSNEPVIEDGTEEQGGIQ